MKQKRNGKKLRASVLAVLLAASMMFGMVPGDMGQAYAADVETTDAEEQGFFDKAKDFFSDMGDGIVSLFAGDSETEKIEPAAAFDENVIADPSTMTTWEALAGQTTENIGRIWTDKTVLTEDANLPGGNAPSVKKEDSDFLVGLSALSSTSNTVAMVSTPLDIILVLDRSGSMGSNNMTVSESYEAVYNLRTGGNAPDYYIQSEDGKYIQISWHNFGSRRDPDYGWGYQENRSWNRITPKTSANDDDVQHIQVYEYESETISRMQALKNAVSNFIDMTAEQNALISNQERKHRISVISYSDSGQRNARLTYAEGQNATTLKNAVRRLNANGGTHPESALQQVQQEFEGAREDAQKIVLFFTDGGPGGTTTNPFDGSVANDTIEQAKILKDNETLIYSIGVLDGADPEDTSENINAYMHGVSSNYPAATSYRDLGKRVENSKYYKVATDANGLNNIFKDISNELSEGVGFPTETPAPNTEGYDPGKTGYVTFTDQLGDYMQVDTFKSLIFADEEFPVKEQVTEGNVTTYKYEGSATGDDQLYPEGNVSDIIVTVEKSENLQTGDIVTVQIPAGLIPLRHFTVETDSEGNTTMAVDETYPIRIFYGVSLKAAVREKISKGLDADIPEDEALQQYMNRNNKDGVPQFYSNYYDGTKTQGELKLGNTIASFQPAEKNTFYYFTENTPVYTDEKCTTPLKGEPGDERYYYKKTYVTKNENGAVEEVTKGMPFDGANFDTATARWAIDETTGQVYITSGSPRLTRVDSLTMQKKTNATGTATEVINPVWDNVNNPDHLNVHLGNNGQLAVELPGALAISKDARVAADKNLDAQTILENKEFTFQISVPAMKDKETEQDRTVKAEVRDEQNEIQGSVFDLKFSEEGIAEYQIKNDETLYIHGLDDGAEYTVTEKDMPDGFELTAVRTGETVDETSKQATGTIDSGNVVSHVFENTYDVDPITITETEGFANYEKTFTRWDIAKEFQIELIPITQGSPLPEGAVDGRKSVIVKKGDTTGNFGAITFEKPGEYYYSIQEKQPSNVIPGVVYSLASYTYQVTVSDDGDGTLSATTKMVKTSSDTGEQLANPETIENKTATFVNDFSLDSTRTSVIASKSYTDNSGTNPLTDGKFTFRFRATGDNAVNAPMPAGTPDEKGYIYTKNDGNGITFGQMQFTDDDVNSTTPWTYEFSEVIPEGAIENADGTYTLNGMTYDGQTYKLSILATNETTENGEPYIRLQKTYTNGAGEAVEESAVVFSNVYDPAPVVLPGEGEEAVKGSKTLIGRNSLPEEKYTFTLSASNTAARNGLANDWIIFENDKTKDVMTATVSGLENDKAVPFNFGNIQFNRPGRYEFNVVENAPANGAGMVYDRHTALVTIVVADAGNGKLDAVTTYYNGSDASASTTEAAFINQYTASTTYGAGTDLIVEKTLNGRDLKANEFTFHIIAQESDTVIAEEANKKLTDADRTFTNTSGAPAGVASQIFGKLSGMSFTQADAGKTYSYVVSEEEPQAALAGVTYSKDTYRLDIQVVDNGNGSMHTVTKVTKPDGTSSDYDSSDTRQTIQIGFTNQYEAADVDVDFTAEAAQFNKQLVGRDWLDTDAFTFTLEAEDGAPMPKNAEGKEIKEVQVTQQAGTADGTLVPFGFGMITYDTAGTYSYTVRETNGGQTIAGVNYSDNVAEVDVIVTDPGDGQLSARVRVYGSLFVNSYSESSGDDDIAAMIRATKMLTGRDMNADEFEFEVVIRGTETVVATGTNTAAKSDTAGNVVFAGTKDGEPFALTYTTESLNKAVEDGYATKTQNENGVDVWTVNYTARELTDSLPKGVKAVDGKTSFDFAIVVTGSTDGMLTAEIQYPEGGIAFVNSYTTGGTEVETIPTETTGLFYKKLTGRDWTATDAFTFTITPQGDAPAPVDTEGNAVTQVTVTKDGAKEGELVPFGFGTIKFTDAHMEGAVVNADGTRSKTFTYQVTENEIDTETMPGVTKVDNKATLTITLTDDGKGNLQAATPSVVNGTFENVYTSEIDYTAAGGLQISKTLVGRDLEDQQFTFTVTPKATEGSTTAKEAAKKLFGTEDVKAYEFKNKADAAEIVDGVAKAVDVIDVLAGKTVTFDQSDAGKTFTYEVAEKAGENTAYAYDTTPRTVTIAVTDNKNATLTVTTTVRKDEEVVEEQKITTGQEGQQKATVAFENTYAVKPVTLGGEGSVKINATKSLTNRPMAEGEFTFYVKDKNDAIAATGTNSADGTITFNAIEYTTDKLIADAIAGAAQKTTDGQSDVYTYDYKVVEDENALGDGVTGVETSFNIQVVVTDDGSGTLSLEVVYPVGMNALLFENAYGAGKQADVAVNGHKNYVVESGDNAPDITGKYTFAITGVDQETGAVAPMPEKTETVNDKAGNVDFGKIAFTMENVFGGEAVEETAEEIVETESAGAETEGVEAGAEGTETETANVEVGVDGTETGTEAADAETGISVAAEEAGIATVAEEADANAGIATADVTEDGDAAVDGEADAAVETETTDANEAEGEVADAVITDEAAGAVTTDDAMLFKSPVRTKTFVYTVTESGNIPGVDNDPEAKIFTVTVTDNGDGTITAVKSWDAMAFEFTNTYRVDPAENYSISTDLKIKKELTGREMKEGEFTFELKDKTGTVVATATNKADGTVTFEGEGGTLTFTQPGIYNYTLSEQKGSVGGVEFDNAVYDVTITVTDNGDGTLRAETKLAEDGKEVLFKNRYEAAPTSVTLGASKIFKGGDLKEGQFTFELKEKDGKVVSEAENGANGQVIFEAINYDEAGTYEYTISEKNDKQKNVTYDETVYGVTVTVTDGGEGHLLANIAYADGKAPVFTNKYSKSEEPEEPEKPTKPEEPSKPEEPKGPENPPKQDEPTAPSKPEEPKGPGAVQTGDATPIIGLAAAMVVSLAAIIAVAVMFFRRRRRK